MAGWSISARLAVGVSIVVAGVQLLREGYDAIRHPAVLTISLLVLVILLASILTKFWLFFYYRKIARIIDSEALFAASKDSLSDVVATSTVLLSMVLQMLFGWQIDGWMGVVVACFVLKTGISVCKDTIDRLLGEKPDPALIHDIKERLLKYEGINGVHDLVVHDYGPGRRIASVHAEVKASDNIVDIHEVIDRAERELQNDLGIVVCIHMDPTVTDDPIINDVHRRMIEFLSGVDQRLTLHDFRMVPGQEQINLVFDCLLPDGYTDKDGLLRMLTAFAKTARPSV